MLPGLLRPAPVTGGAVTGGAVIACQGKLQVSSAQQQCIRLARVSPRLTSGFKHVATPPPMGAGAAGEPCIMQTACARRGVGFAGAPDLGIGFVCGRRLLTSRCVLVCQPTTIKGSPRLRLRARFSAWLPAWCGGCCRSACSLLLPLSLLKRATVSQRLRGAWGGVSTAV